ncbi:hypothetical protein [Varunaivibrio sulfuroxidans]|uniref:Uncharacterized protein n=1 Tax=Varunaivibrio sulfuroxidans TaxID=1773489 RepID=A0A4R3JEJ9_9PROT|nr:hypothetical protein [Varunaivibrio sulfuroxidans]TCS63653.1 hypothetical protein EDD55_103276 [Varunaivibrio sulfuroxidans]WES30209.1 hypothetical protein P3M64_11270 [Varunaivibrio sulfuroxidans]
MTPRKVERPETRPTTTRQTRFVGLEPSLDEVLGDPITHKLMASDGVDLSELTGLIAQSRRNLRVGL